MEKIFRYRLDRLSRRITWAIIGAVILVTAWSVWYFFNTGFYYPAWFVSLALSVAALYILSIPRSLRVTDEAIEIHCIVELTKIDAGDIHAVRRFDARRTRLWLLLGSYGFFGYYGYYLDWRQWQIVKVYASRREDLVEIEDIYEQRYVVSCDDPEAFIEAAVLLRARYEKEHAAEKENPENDTAGE